MEEWIKQVSQNKTARANLHLLRIKKCHPRIVDAIEYLSEKKSGVYMTGVSAVCFKMGRGRLWSMPGIGVVRDKRNDILRLLPTRKHMDQAEIRKRLSVFAINLLRAGDDPSPSSRHGTRSSRRRPHRRAAPPGRCRRNRRHRC